MAPGFSMDSVFDIISAVAYQLRVELGFILVFGFLWLAALLVFGKARPLDGTKGGHGRKSHQSGVHQTEQRRRSSLQHRLAPCSAENGTLTQDRLPLVMSVHSIDPAKLRDASWLVPQIVNRCRSQVQRALELYRVAMKAGAKLQQFETEDCRQMFSALVTSAIRVGQADEALRVLQDLQRQGPGLDMSLFTSATKLCTSKQLFPECLAIYDFMLDACKLEVNDKTVWSCLLFCAIETKSYHRCSFFFEQLRTYGEASSKDFSNMVRFASSTGEWELALKMLEDMRKASVEIDSIVYNTVLASCVVAEQVDAARKLLEQVVKDGGVADVIAFNTLSKGYAKAGRIDECCELYDWMRSLGIKPSQVTYGILLDSCINENQIERAAQVFETMKAEGCPMNTVLYTTLIKGFARAGQVDQATRIYEQMRTERTVAPDLITFSILIKANCDHGDLEVSLKLMAEMRQLGLKPDEVVFNNLLGGCVNWKQEGNVELAKSLYKDMISAGVRPSNATYSILIRLYSQCKMLDEAVDLLRHEPVAHGVRAEARLYAQLAQCCLRERQGRRAVEVYKMLTEHSTPTPAVHSSMLGMCIKLNMLDTGAEILSLAASVGGRVDARDAAALMDAAVKKKKPQVVETLRSAMMQLKLPVSA
ncbi:unnamed protein product [Polarella glacialis]|uniref:PROP1-like PPR domain-containing protein n=1 Tax=Polarella glacialis TaxID=89957 RepID=A0A813KP84_POLGL|nr:unnamed protein product [Polarella glacialis]